jgi:hypothetical protein
MRGITFLLAAFWALPLIAAPLPGLEHEEIERRLDAPIADATYKILVRGPIVEALPAETRPDVTIEELGTESSVSPEEQTGSDNDEHEEDDQDSVHEREKRARRPGKGSQKRARRPGKGSQKRARRPGKGSQKRARRSGN